MTEILLKQCILLKTTQLDEIIIDVLMSCNKTLEINDISFIFIYINQRVKKRYEKYPLMFPSSVSIEGRIFTLQLTTV